MATVGSTRLTGVVFDPCLEAHYSLWNKDYTEHPLRTKVCVERCEELKLLSRCKRIPVRESTFEEIQACHTKHHYELLRSTRCMDEKSLQKMSQQYDYTYFHQASFLNANLALGATIDLVDEIVTDKINNGMAIVRPPGHHAMREEFSGYCYYNNVAVAAQLMMDRHGLDRIIILDWDVHHGQGSQFLVYNDPRVLYVSIHRYEFGEEWPCLRESDYDFIGEAAGRGYNINLPLNEIGCGNDEFLSMFFHVLLPVFHEFNPQLVLVSAGYDCAIGCPEGEMEVTPACFAHFVNLLTPLASGKLALILEGGYNLNSLAESAALSLRALLGDPTPSISPISTPKLCVIESILNVVKCLHPYWKSLCYTDVTGQENISEQSHPYPKVLQNPPKAGMNFYNDDTRPKLFPLLQDCVGDSVMETMDEINKKIEMLIKNTSLFCPQYKLVISSDSHPASVQTSSSVAERLKSKDLWKHCIQLNTPEDTTQSTQLCISKSIDMVLDRKSEAGLVITGSRAEAPSLNSKGRDQCVASAIKYAKNNAVKRLLVINIADSEFSPTIIDVTSGILHITLTLPASGESRAKKGTEWKTDDGLSGSNITIPFGKNPVTDADLLAVFHLIILPVSYEFCPDFVLFSWQSMTSVSLPVMGVLTRYLHGLAQGQMLILVGKSPSSPGSGEEPQQETGSNTAENEVDLISHCGAVLLGEQCKRLSSRELSNSTIDMIKETLDSLKQHWKTLVYRVQVPKPSS